MDGFLGYVQRATSVSVTVSLTSLGRVKVLVSETAELALEHCLTLPFQLGYHLQTSEDRALVVEIRVSRNPSRPILLGRHQSKF